jgi:ketosteroid isomerase-like protein
VKREQLDDIRRLYEAMNRRDIDALRAFGERYPGFSWQSADDELGAPGKREAGEALAYSRDLFEMFDEMQTDILETIELQAGHVIFVVCHSMRGAASGASVERREVHLWTVSQDGTLSLREFRTVEEAHSAAAPA